MRKIAEADQTLSAQVDPDPRPIWLGHAPARPASGAPPPGQNSDIFITKSAIPPFSDPPPATRVRFFFSKKGDESP